MATRKIDLGPIPYNSAGVYFRTFDNTVVTEAIGTFSGAAIGLMEKGPAFSVNVSNTYTERALRLGGLNPNFMTTYFAKQYLEQARNYKEVRILGLEGYKDTLGFAIVGRSNSSNNPTFPEPMNIGKGQLLCVLKLRKTSFTGLPPVSKVELEKVITRNPNTGQSNWNAATDYMFKLVVTFATTPTGWTSNVMEIVASLREDSKDYIVKKLGNDPRTANKVGSEISPLWVDFIVPSIEEMPYNYAQKKFMSKNYYEQGTNTMLVSGFVNLLEGDISFSTAATVNTVSVEDIQLSTTNVTISVPGNITSWLSNNDGVSFVGVKDANSGGLELINNSFKADQVVFDNANNVTKFIIKDINTDIPLTENDFGSFASFMPKATIDNVTENDTYDVLDIEFNTTNTRVIIAGDVTSSFTANVPGTAGDVIQLNNVLGQNVDVLNDPTSEFVCEAVTLNAGNTYVTINMVTDPLNPNGDPLVVNNASFELNEPLVNKIIIPTWETGLLDYENQQFLTPVTPWFVSEVDNNGDYKRLFRFISISDGEAANTEIKIDVKNINQQKNTFDIVVRAFSNRDDGELQRYESFTNLTMDPNSDNYILRRIGDGEEFVLRSRYIFVELNLDETLEFDLLPFGCLGYPNVEGEIIQDIPWSVDYDKTKQVSKQTLGMAFNTINMRKPTSPDLLSYKSSRNVFGRGFHLNPPTLSTGEQLPLDSEGKILMPSQNVPQEKVDELNDTFIFASPAIYSDIRGRVVNITERVNRNKFTVGFYGGFDGWNVYNEKQWNDPTSKDYAALQLALSLLNDNETTDTDFTVMVTPDLNIDEHSLACTSVHDMITLRGDAVYLPDLRYDVDADAFSATERVLSSNFRSNNIAIYFPWIQISDTLNKVNQWCPPSLLALGTIASLGNQEQIWNPAGGVIKTIVNNLVRARRRMNLNDREELIKANINPISSFGNGAYEIVGVRTTQPYLSALSYLHNTLLLCYATKILKQTLREMLFTMNNEQARDQFIARVTPIFERIKRLNGLSTYEVYTRTDLALTDKTTLHGVVEIVPLYPVEKIVVDFVLNDGELNIDQ